MKKKILCSILSLGLVGSFALSSVSAENLSEVVPSEVAAKRAFAEQYSHELKVDLSSEEKVEYREELDSTIAKLVAQGATENEIDKVIRQFNAHVFKTETNPDKNEVSPLSQASNVTLTKPIITYSGTTGEWTVTGGGHWNNEAWKADTPGVWVPITGQTKIIGGPDSIGLTYYNKSGTYNAKVLRSAGYLYDGRGNEVKNPNPTYGSGAAGVAFEIQDYMKLVNAGTVDVAYMGNNFAAQITYDSNFKNLHGNARTMYVHTWDTAKISSISLGVSGGNFGANVTISNAAKSFTVFNNADASF
ncbi:hypothetical protein [Paenibacillus sp. SAF-068]|uniref:hypothetical protein n=1 Tax=Paenibacillus sp. SAF-068 TaxID=3436864 RepID=UPI003F81A02C